MRREVVWPGAPSGRDCWDDGFWPSLDEHGRFAALWTAWDAVREGRAPDEVLERAAETAGLTGPLTEDRNRPHWDGHPPSLEELARLAADHWPAVGEDGPDLVLGPASLFASRELRLAAVAGCAFVTTADVPFSCVHVWARQRPEPPRGVRRRVHDVGLTPWALWAAEHRADGLHLRDATGLGAFYQPDGPVRVIGDLPVGAAVAARVMRTPTGWVAHTAVPLPGLPPHALIQRWLTHETWLARTHQPGIPVEALLRRRPVLVRRAIAWCEGVL